MEPSGSQRSGLLTAGGVLSVIAGAIEVAGGAGGIALFVNWLDPVPYEVVGSGWWWLVMGFPVLALGIVAIVGGVAAMKRRNYSMSLAGAICALPLAPLGIPAVILVALRKREFEAVGVGKGALLKAGGILSIVVGAFQVIGGAITTGTVVVVGVISPGIMGVPMLALGIVAIVGGVSALRRESFGLALAGAICALPSAILGILAVVFVALSRREFQR